MNIIHDGLTINSEDGLLTKTKKVVKMAIKTTAYTAFLGIAVASALHLYNNPDDRAAVKSGLKSVGLGIETKINDSVFQLTGHNLTTHIAKVSNFAEKGINSAVDNVKEITPTKKETQHIAKNVQTAGEILKEGVKQHSPGIEKTIEKDSKEAPAKAKEEVQHSIKQIRQYTGDLAQRLANSIKP